MRIAICGSLAFADKMISAKKELSKLGHTAVFSKFADEFIGLTEDEKRKKNERNFQIHDVIRAFWEEIKKSDAILVLNYDRKGIKYYIGGNTLMEIGFAHVLHKKIFLMNPIPKIEFYEQEIAATKPVILNEDLHKIA
ncbi:hypothetical protein HY468_00385 [Candidatus Roizmanbacteria bacterium]|nr:hypothetical protein [Candidatus Roizmanbacteria bacterium]